MTTKMKMMTRIDFRNRRIDSETAANLIEAQLEEWPEARERYLQLGKTERRRIALGSLDAAVQCNPARIRSTGAKVDTASVAARPCFLCEANRPDEQFSVDWVEGWDLLINPFPILPVHFTIVSRRHEPQQRFPFDAAIMAELMPGAAIFFNGARAGASAPDHLHLQAVLKDELPLLRLAEERHPASKKGFLLSHEIAPDAPFAFVSAVIPPDETGAASLMKLHTAFGIDKETDMPDAGLVNIFIWMGKEGVLRAVAIPRSAHRPLCYSLPEGERIVVSPGAIDMAGIMISPRPDDFNRIDADIMRDIYGEVAFADSLHPLVEAHFKN